MAEALVKQVGTPHSKFVLEAHSDITEKQLWAIRNALWNAMKHANKRDGTPRDDEELLSKPLEEENEARLYEGWFNLMQIMPIPV
ncbi:MAG TPA: hypothetical protein VKZ46_01785, partial [Pedomonas sp.]|nr:hypothetical protein [Pedomonas sp.]